MSGPRLRRGPRRSHKMLESVQRLRRDNLRAVFARYKNAGIYETVKEFTKAFAQAPALYHSIAGPNPHRMMGEGLARDIEYRLGLPQGYLDKDHGDLKIR